MNRTLLKSKLHRASVTQADMHYEGSISIDRTLMERADILPYEKVDIYNINTGARFSTYVIPGGAGEIGLNGAAARMVQVGDRVIIANYASYTDAEAKHHKARKLLLNEKNEIEQELYN